MQRGLVHFLGAPGGGAGPDDRGAVGQPLAAHHRLHRGGNGDNQIAIPHRILIAVHRHYFETGGFSGGGGKGLAALGVAAERLDLRHFPPWGDGLQLRQRLPAGADEADGQRAGVGEMLHRYAGGGAGTQLPQAVGLGVAQQLAGGGIVEADLKGVGAAHHGVGLDAQQAGVEQPAAHHRQHSRLGDDFAAAQVVGLPGAVMPLHGFDAVQHRLHGHALGYFAVTQKQSHQPSTGRGCIAGGGPAGNAGRRPGLLEEIPVLGQVVAPLGGDAELVEDGVDRANGFAVGTIDAGGRVDVILLFLLGGLDAVHRANLDARSVFNPDAGLDNDVGHSGPVGPAEGFQAPLGVAAAPERAI